MNRSLLPIGSVVLLNNSNKRVMIVGRVQKNTETGKVWDYSACLYPEGMINPSELILFNDDQINSVYFIGFQDLEGLKLQELINKNIDKIKAESKG